MAQDYPLQPHVRADRRPPAQPIAPTRIWNVILAATLGTLIEWYDFFIFGSLAPVISTQFFPKSNPTAALLSTLATFGVGFAARPFGALIFGRIGDKVGRKYAFLVTLVIMGGATTLIGILPTYARIGIAAPLLLVIIRLAQGLAIGGEYGGAAVYVAEHVPDNRRGFYTSFIQLTAPLSLFVSLVVILIVRGSMTPAAFDAWGWRIPFLLSLVLVGVSVYVRSKLRESPVFVQLKAAGKTSRTPLADSFRNRANWRVILLVLFGTVAGQAVISSLGQFYVNLFLQSPGVGVPFGTASVIMAVALALSLPFFVVFGGLSDRVGRKRIMVAGNLLAAVCSYPIFRALKAFAGPLTQTATTSDAGGMVSPVLQAMSPNVVMLTLLVFILLLFVAMVFGPIAAFLVESFPARIRYTSVSVAYHIGNGYFAGFLPLIAVAAVSGTGNIYAGLIFPILVALITCIIGACCLRETRHISIHDEVGDMNQAVVGA